VSDLHQHQWQTVAHLDGCHSYEWVYACECGASRETYNERSVEEDGWSAVWMMDDDGKPMCGRCEELLNGAEPKSRDDIRAVVA
jgi:hypothetical protein